MLECLVRGMEAGKGDGAGGMQKDEWGVFGALTEAGVEAEMLTNFSRGRVESWELAAGVV
jgi:hypothetical protein